MSAPPTAAAKKAPDAMDIMRQNQSPPGVLRLLTWNIDGLDQDHGDLIERCVSVIEYIVDNGFTIVLLQEIVEPTLQTIRRFLSPLYDIHFPQPFLLPYFSIILTQKQRVKVIGKMERTTFPTRMGRELLSMICEVDGHRYYVSTAHLESQKQGEAYRF